MWHYKSRGVIFFLWNRARKNQWGSGYLVKQNRSTFKRVVFFSVRMLYIVLIGRWFNIILLNKHATTEEKSGYI